MKTVKSKRIFLQARKVMAGGVNSPVRAFQAVGGDPLLVNRGLGPRIYDLDGNALIDYCLSWGALILGHSHADVTKAVQGAVKNGISYGTTTAAEVDMAKRIVRHVPSIDMVRFVNSGTEATMSAVRLARGFTKRSKVIKFDGCYHGHSDGLLAMAGSGVALLAASSSQGIARNHVQDTVSLPFNDTQALIETLGRYHQDVACVIVEPVPGNMGVILPDPFFLKTLRKVTKKYGILLIFDEVMSGFRGCLGGVQADFGVIPDLTCLGKIIGGGFPIGAYGGRRDIMKHLAPLGGVYQAGTFSGNPIVMKAGLAVFEHLTPSFYRKLNQMSYVFSTQMNTWFRQKGIEAHFSFYKSMLSLRFKGVTVSDYNAARNASSQKLYSRLFHHLLNCGIYWPPADLEALFISASHRHQHLNQLKKAIQDFFLAEGEP